MNKPAAIAWLRRAISLLLLVCLALPLTRCSVVKEPVAAVAVAGARNAPSQAAPVVAYQENKPLYAGRLIIGQFESFPDMKPDDLFHLLMLLAIFFLPALVLFARPITQSCIHAGAALPALAYLAFIIFGLMGEALIGGWLAMGSWAVLLVLGVHGIVAQFRLRRTQALAESHLSWP